MQSSPMSLTMVSLSRMVASCWQTSTLQLAALSTFNQRSPGKSFVTTTLCLPFSLCTCIQQHAWLPAHLPLTSLLCTQLLICKMLARCGCCTSSHDGTTFGRAHLDRNAVGLGRKATSCCAADCRPCLLGSSLCFGEKARSGPEERHIGCCTLTIASSCVGAACRQISGRDQTPIYE